MRFNSAYTVHRTQCLQLKAGGVHLLCNDQVGCHTGFSPDLDSLNPIPTPSVVGAVTPVYTSSWGG